MHASCIALKFAFLVTILKPAESLTKAKSMSSSSEKVRAACKVEGDTLVESKSFLFALVHFDADSKTYACGAKLNLVIAKLTT